MTTNEKLQAFAERCNYLEGDIGYLSKLLREAKAEAYEEAAQTAKTLEVRCSDCSAMNEHDVCETADGEAIASAILALRDSLVASS